MSFWKWLFSMGLLIPMMLVARQRIAICACFQNEADWLEEWLAYQFVIGVDHVILYNHRSTDNWYPIVRPYIARGWVEVRPLVEEPYAGHAQHLAYMDCVEKDRDAYDWIGFIDIDEFICLHPPYNSLSQLLQEVGEAPALVLNWQMFGTSGVWDLRKGELMIETLLEKAPSLFVENQHVKTIARPRQVQSILNAHSFTYRRGEAVNSSGESVRGPRCPVKTHKAQINHYWTRTEHFFQGKKLARRASFGEESETAQHRADALHGVRDVSILRWTARVRQLMQRMRG